MTLIDKAALLNRIATEVHYDSERSLEMYAKLLNEINDAPTVEAVPLEGYKSMEQTVNWIDYALCPYCEQMFNPKIVSEYDYCPHCGGRIDNG